MLARTKRYVALSAAAFVIPAALGCGEKTGKVNAGGGPQAGSLTGPQSPSADQNNSGTNPQNPQVDPNKIVTDNRILDVVAKINAKAIGISACSGDLGLRIKLQLDPNDKEFKMIEVPTDTIKCMLIGELGLKKMLEGDGKPQKEPPKIDKPIAVEKNLMSFALLGSGHYPKKRRPFMPAFLSASPAQLKTIDVTEAVEVIDWLNKPGVTVQGTVTAKTLDYRKTFRHEPMNRDFKEVYDFEFKNEGFKDFNRISAFLFDRMFMRISLKPFAILRFEMSTSVSKLMAGAQAGGAVGGGTAGGSGTATGGGTGILGGLGGLIGGSGAGAGTGGAAGGLLGGAGGGLISILGELIQVHIEADIIEQAGLPPPGQEDVNDDVQIGKDSKKDDDDKKDSKDDE